MLLKALQATPASKPPAVLAFDEVRRAIRLGRARSGSEALIEGLFHDLCRGLLDPRGSVFWGRVLGEDELGDVKKLSAAAYERILGPRLSQSQAAIQGSTAEVMRLWKAVGALCGWLTCQLQTAAQDNRIHYDRVRDAWSVAAAEEPAVRFREIADAGSQQVMVSGAPETVWRSFEQEWFVLEFGDDAASEEVARLEAAACYELYCGGDAEARLTEVRFTPGPQARTYTAHDLTEARRAFRALVRKLANEASKRQAGPPPRADEFRLDLEEALAYCGTPGVVVGTASAAPAFLRYSVELTSPVRGATLPADLQHRLRLSETPLVRVEGTRARIDVPRPDRQMVAFASIEAQLPAREPRTGSAWIPVGVDAESRLRCVNLADPAGSNILVSGAARSGKTEWLRAAIAGLMARNTPDTLRLLLIDPKHTAFADLKDSPFLLTPPVFPPEDSASQVFAMLTDELDDRLRQIAPSPSFDEYSAAGGERLPRIVCICDEYALLAPADSEARRQVEAWIGRLGARARLAGIHLIVATERPNRDVLAGVVAAQMCCRVTFKTASALESRMAILEPGAENLLGYGDLLFRDLLHPVRLQGALAGQEDLYRLLAPYEPAAGAGRLLK